MKSHAGILVSRRFIRGAERAIERQAEFVDLLGRDVCPGRGDAAGRVLTVMRILAELRMQHALAGRTAFRELEDADCGVPALRRLH